MPETEAWRFGEGHIMAGHKVPKSQSSLKQPLFKTQVAQYRKGLERSGGWGVGWGGELLVVVVCGGGGGEEMEGMYGRGRREKQNLEGRNQSL